MFSLAGRFTFFGDPQGREVALRPAVDLPLAAADVDSEPAVRHPPADAPGEGAALLVVGVWDRDRVGGVPKFVHPDFPIGVIGDIGVFWELLVFFGTLAVHQRRSIAG